MQWSLRNKVLGGYGLMLALTGVVGVLGLAAVNSLSRELATSSDVLAPSLSDADDIGRTISAARQTVDTFVTSPTRVDRQEVQRVSRVLAGQYDTLIADLDRIGQRQPPATTQAAVRNLRALLTEWNRQTKVVLDVADQRPESAIATLGSVRQIYATAEQAASDMALGIRRELQDMAVRGSRWYMLQQAGLLILMVGAAGVAVNRVTAAQRTTRKMQEISATCVDAGNDLQSAAGQVSMSAQSLAQTASEQATSLEETSATMEELASMT